MQQASTCFQVLRSSVEVVRDFWVLAQPGGGLESYGCSMAGQSEAPCVPGGGSVSVTGSVVNGNVS